METSSGKTIFAWKVKSFQATLSSSLIWKEVLFYISGSHNYLLCHPTMKTFLHRALWMEEINIPPISPYYFFTVFYIMRVSTVLIITVSDSTLTSCLPIKSFRIPLRFHTTCLCYPVMKVVPKIVTLLSPHPVAGWNVCRLLKKSLDI